MTKVLTGFDRLYATLTNEPPEDRPEFSSIATDAVYATVPPEARGTYLPAMEAFVNAHRSDLKAMLRDYGPGSALGKRGCYKLVQVPVVLAVVERLTVRPLWLAQEFADRFEHGDTLIEDVIGAWGGRG